jgi:alpha-1,6-mannosyltransferase
MALRRGALLLGAGLTTEAIYLAITLLLPWWRYGGRLDSWSQILGSGWGPFALCLAGIGLLMGVYLLGWRVVRGGQVKRRVVWGFAALCAVTLVWLMPITSDLFTYLSHAHMFTDLAANPLVVAPLDSVGDRLLDAYRTVYAGRPSVYGPAWVLISTLGTWGPFDVAAGLAYLKAVSFLAYLLCAWLLERIVHRIQPTRATEALYLFAWNPLVLLMGVGDGHNDIVMMAAVLLAFSLLLQERWALAFGVLALSVWIKYISVLFFLPVAIYAWRRFRAERGRRPWPLVARAGLALAGVSALVLVPFSTLETTRSFGAWVAGILERLIRPVNWHEGVLGLSTWALAVGLLLFVGLYTVLVWRLARCPVSYERMVDAGFVASLWAFLLGSARAQPWYLIWPIAMAGLSDRRWAWPAVVGLSAIMLVVQVWVEWGAPGAQILL